MNQEQPSETNRLQLLQLIQLASMVPRVLIYHLFGRHAHMTTVVGPADDAVSVQNPAACFGNTFPHFIRTWGIT